MDSILSLGMRNGLLLTFVILLIISGCGHTNHSDEKEIKGYQFLDDANRTVLIGRDVQRVMGLSPSITEILMEVCPEKVIARTQACDYPEEVENLPIVNSFPLDVEGVIKQKPDVVFAIHGMIKPGEIESLEQVGVKLILQDYLTIQDIKKGIITIGNITGDTLSSEKLVQEMSNNLNQIKRKGEKLDSVYKVLAITWFDPIYAYGYNSPFTEKIAIAGGINGIQEDLGNPYPEITVEYILKMNPDIIIGSTPEKMEKEFFSRYPDLKSINAYKKQWLFDVDDNLMSRPSPRVADGIMELHNILKNVE